MRTSLGPKLRPCHLAGPTSESTAPGSMRCTALAHRKSMMSRSTGVFAFGSPTHFPGLTTPKAPFRIFSPRQRAMSFSSMTVATPLLRRAWPIVFHSDCVALTTANGRGSTTSESSSLDSSAFNKCFPTHSSQKSGANKQAPLPGGGRPGSTWGHVSHLAFSQISPE